MESSDPMRVDQWSSPPPLLASPPFDNNTFAIAPQASSDASSTTTSTLTTALNSSESEEAGSSSRTTPAISDVSEDLSKNQDDEVSKQIVTEAAQVQNATPAVVADHSDLQTTTTRRRSSRLSAFKTPANTSTPKASATSGTAPATPHPRTNTTTLETPANSGNASSSTTGSASRALRSSAGKEDPKESPAPEIKEQPQEETGRRTRRQSAINALAKLTETTPRNAKRSHEAMVTGSKSAGPKIPGSSVKKAKLNDATSSPQPSETSDISETPSEEPHRPKKRRKVWINQGLYVGQDDADEKTLNMRPATKNKKGKKSQAPRPNALPTPIFRGKEIMNTVRDFKLPFHVFAPLPIKPPVPKDWRKLNHSRHSRSYTLAFYNH
jgi:histone-lysine N-methyltransferase ASH1L